MGKKFDLWDKFEKNPESLAYPGRKRAMPQKQIDKKLSEQGYDVPKKNYMANPDGSKTEVGPDLDTPTQNDVDAANRKYRAIGKSIKTNSFSELKRLKNEANRPGYVPERIKPGTIKKAIAFVAKETKNPHWKEAEKKIVSMFDKVSGGSQQGLKPTMAKAFKYSCPDCGHTDEVATGGFGESLNPKKWPCRKCGKENTKMTTLDKKPTPKWTEAQWKEYRSNPENTKPISAFHTGDPKVKKSFEEISKMAHAIHYADPKFEKFHDPKYNYRNMDCGANNVHRKHMSGNMNDVTCTKCRSQFAKTNLPKPPVVKALDEFMQKYGTK
jgi:ribosomal protein L37AE/L43A